MKFKPGFFDGWLLAILVSVCITALTLFLLYNTHDLQRSILLPVGVMVFWVAFLVVFAFMELVVLREAKRIYKITQKKKKKKDQNTPLDVEQPGLFNPLRRVYEEVFSFSNLQEKEIEDLKKVEAFRREFVANISHELKTPLFAAQGFIHTLIDGAAGDEAIRTRFLNKAAKSLDSLENLVQDLLMLSHIEIGEIKMKIVPVDMLVLIKELLEDFEEAVNRKKVKLKLIESKKISIALADSKWIKQVISNLISNAINHTEEGGQVTVKIDVSKKFVETSVSDTGIGISEEHLPRIFERFYRVDKSRSREHGGTGLGLAIVKHILESHQSKADVKSEPGKGSEFSFKLNRVKHDD